MPRLDAVEAQRWIQRLIEAVGTPPPIAARVAEVLVGADLAGHPSHGAARLAEYLKQVGAGTLRPAAEPAVVRESPATAVMDAAHGWGPWSVDRAMRLAVEKARSAGCGAVAVFRVNHAGRIGEYVELAAREGCVGVVLAGVGGRGVGCAAPPGSRERRLGSNPLAVGVPTEGPPFLLDMATTVAARGKLRVAADRGERVPEGWIVDAAGEPTTDPAAFFGGGSLLHAAGHKGYGLALAACLIGGLSGGFQPEGARMGGILALALDPAAFGDREAYRTRAGAFLDGFRGAEPARPDGEVLVPGDPEQRSRQRLARSGIELSEPAWQALATFSRDQGILLPEPVPTSPAHAGPEREEAP